MDKVTIEILSLNNITISLIAGLATATICFSFKILLKYFRLPDQLDRWTTRLFQWMVTSMAERYFTEGQIINCLPQFLNDIEEEKTLWGKLIATGNVFTYKDPEENIPDLEESD